MGCAVGLRVGVLVGFDVGLDDGLMVAATGLSVGISGSVAVTLVELPMASRSYHDGLYPLVVLGSKPDLRTSPQTMAEEGRRREASIECAVRNTTRNCNVKMKVRCQFSTTYVAWGSRQLAATISL